jgi:tRNA modification GTPase
MLEGARELEAARRIQSLLATAACASALITPPRVALIGPPNAGKSTLLNALLEQERVIVHHQPGTTRDVVTERVSVRGVPFDLMDSAGIRRAEDDVEAHAVDRARNLASICDVALLLFDAREDAAAALADIPRPRAGARSILVANKVDLLQGAPHPPLPAALQAHPLVLVSAKEGINIEGIEDQLLARYAEALERCRSGGAMLFIREGELALKEALRRMDEADGTGAAAVLRDAGVEAGH